MRFRHPDGSTVHLAYCTNVHAAENLDGVLAQLVRYSEPVRQQLDVDRLGLGLWLAAPLVRELVADPAALARLKRELERRALEVVTLNAFPYQAFHAPEVKKAVYHPDWSEPARLHHTLACARVLASLLPADVGSGSISTLPLGWREPWTPEHARLARRHLDALASRLPEGIRVALEPEPGCVVEHTRQAATMLAGVDTERIGVCLDTCHLAVAFETPLEAVARLSAAGLPVVKTQVSCAVQVDDPADPAARAELAAFAERRFLHQTRERTPAGILGADDLPDALAGALPGDDPWRVHFHVPVHTDPPPPLRSTRPHLVESLDVLLGGRRPLTHHLEVETYTWPVLPSGAADLVMGIAAEVEWTRAALEALGLTGDGR